MRITNIAPVADPGGGKWRTIAVFDVELTDSVRLFGMRMLQGPNGVRRTYAPSSGGRRFATFAPELAGDITTAAIEKYEGQETADECNRSN